MTDHPDTDLTDHHGEAEALRRENERLRAEIAEATDPEFIWGALDNVHDCDTTMDDYAAAVSRAQRAALAASRAPDPVVNGGSGQPGDLISRAAAVEVAASIADRQRPDNMPHEAYMAHHSGAMDVLDAIRALPAAPVAEAPTIGGTELDALVARLRSFDGDGHTRFAGKTICESAADAITALRAQPDWKAMAERLGEALAEANDAFAGIADHILRHKNAPTKIKWPGVFADCQRGGIAARAALSDLAKMNGE